MTNINLDSLNIDPAMLSAPSNDAIEEPDLPLSAIVGYYDPLAAKAKYARTKDRVKAQYYADKLVGRRRSTGTSKLKKLTPRHRRIVAMHLEGLVHNEIALFFGCTAATISGILHDPLVNAILKANADMVEKELAAMGPLAAQVVRGAMSSPDTKTALTGVDRWIKLVGKGDKETAGSVTNNLNIQLNGARDKLIEGLKSINVIDVVAE